jgi:N-acetyl-1-D-myo-inositol-2-amino-2-deoxy-alpha-D-glucopyranoside deacetylase
MEQRWWVTAAFLIIISAIAYIVWFRVDHLILLAFPVKTQPQEIGQRTLIVAPHPDDETLGGAGVIQKAVAARKSIKVVIITTGDGYRTAVKSNFGVHHPTVEDFRRLGFIRYKESLEALQHLGVKPENVHFLGYPDGGIKRLWENDWDYHHLHHGLNGADHSPYPFSYENDAPYCGKNLVKNLSQIIQSYQPTDIVYPDPYDRHPDHWAVNAFVKYTLAKNKRALKEWNYLVHKEGFPYPRTHKPALALLPPTVLAGTDTQWHYYRSNEAEKHKKFEAIQKYKTQTRVMNSFLSAFVRTNEMLATYTDPTLTALGAEGQIKKALKDAPLIFSDQALDSTNRGTGSDADLVTFGALHTTDHLAFGLETKTSIEPKVQYSFHVRLMTSKGVKRVDAVVRGERLSFRRQAKNSIVPLNGGSIFMFNNRLWTTFPMNGIPSLYGFMISVETSLGSEQIDRSAWRYVQVQR